MKTIQDYKKAIATLCLKEQHGVHEVNRNNKQELYVLTALMASYTFTPLENKVTKENQITPQELQAMIKKTVKD